MIRVLFASVLIVAFSFSTVPAQSPGQVPPKVDEKLQFKPLQKGNSVLSLLPEGGLWVDLKRKWVIADGEICLREGQLEMLACPQGTKEHESVVSVKSSARFVHAALLAVGAKTGTPVKFDPDYIPASGSVIDVICVWKDEKGVVHTISAQQWITKGRSKKTLEHAWVFAGSGFWTEASTGKKRYYGDDGSLICVSNFPTATMDIAVESTKDNNFLEYHANSSKVPEVRTPVRLILVNRPGEVTKKAPKCLEPNAEIFGDVKKWTEAIEAGKEPPKPKSTEPSQDK